MLKKLNRHEVLWGKRVVKIVEALSEEVVETIDMGIRMKHRTGKRTKQEEKIQRGGEKVVFLWFLCVFFVNVSEINGVFEIAERKGQDL